MYVYMLGAQQCTKKAPQQTFTDGLTSYPKGEPIATNHLMQQAKQYKCNMSNPAAVAASMANSCQEEILERDRYEAAAHLRFKETQ